MDWTTWPEVLNSSAGPLCAQREIQKAFHSHLSQLIFFLLNILRKNIKIFNNIYKQQ